jgi:hypothetical protein
MIYRLGILPWFTCNVTCSYCFYKSCSLTGYLSPFSLSHALDSVKHELAPEVTIHFTGGEPLIDTPQLRRYIEIVRATVKIASVVISSNGTVDITRSFDILQQEVPIVFVITIDTLGQSSWRSASGRPLVGARILDSIPNERPYGVAVVTPVLPDLTCQDYIDLVQYANKKGIWSFELNLVKGLQYDDIDAVAMKLQEILVYCANIPGVQLHGDWLAFLREGSARCKRIVRHDNDSAVLFPDGSLRFCELDVGHVPQLERQPESCPFAHAQMAVICETIRHQQHVKMAPRV